MRQNVLNFLVGKIFAILREKEGVFKKNRKFLKQKSDTKIILKTKNVSRETTNFKRDKEKWKKNLTNLREFYL